MSISLNDLANRLNKLEASTTMWTNGSNGNGSWVRETGSGLTIQWGSSTGNITFPIAFKTTSYGAVLSIVGGSNASIYASIHSLGGSFSTTGMNIGNTAWVGVYVASYKWIAIGY